MKIFTCTPKSFKGDATFFARDSGLVCRGLQMIGIESKAIMPEPSLPDDDHDLIRTDYANLESCDWWRSLRIDGLIFYSWGDPKYTKIAKAIKQANIKLLVNMDTGGLFTPFVGYKSFWYGLHISNVSRYGSIIGNFYAGAKLLRSLIPQVRDLPRIKHLDHADVVSAISPIASIRIKQFLNFYNKKNIANQVVMIPHPVSTYLKYSGAKKDNHIICIGRWDDPVKDLELAVRVAAYAMKRHNNYRVTFIGTGSNMVTSILKDINLNNKTINSVGNISHVELLKFYDTSKISLCSSISESGHTVSEEALCCGCSVVAPNSPTLPSMPYYISRNSGQLGERSVQGLGEALSNEINAWERGKRDPVSISRYWCEELHADRIARKMVMALDLAV